ncbi:hypothetical protein BUALT_Bualt13G0091500 [Buddleja alternifolia]|uniref:hAT-like transposase RNase-H fold domain-containing protein n=1 Tax=Buddleja alternifolia TaxID=168488 RepID=A0AAV6WTN0_9LAMI|nr:hypothetical protein BUALT_Bualt13G0091500 [Buddleja alternifolia]
MDWLKDADQCSAYFFKKIAIRRNRARIFFIHDENGNELRDQLLIRDELVRFYSNLLGGSATSQEIDIPDFKCYVRRQLTPEDSLYMIRPIEMEELKKVLLEFPDEKAPGPDGYTAVFFKKAWPVVPSLTPTITQRQAHLPKTSPFAAPPPTKPLSATSTAVVRQRRRQPQPKPNPPTTTQPQPAAVCHLRRRIRRLHSHPPPPSNFPPPPQPSATSVAGTYRNIFAQLKRKRKQSILINFFPPITDMNIGTPGDTFSHPTPSAADSTSPIFCSREETSERPMDFVDPSINEELDNIENTDMIASDDDVQKPKRAKTSQLSESNVDPSSVPAFDGKFDMEKVKVEIAKWIMIHEYAFSAVEDEWFTIMMKRTNPEFVPMSRTTIRNQCVKIYENEKRKLKNEFKYVNKMSITTDCWKSKNQKIEYLAITGHWIDQNWLLQKRVLNFVEVPPPRRGVDIANVIWRCLEDWGIEGKIHTVSVDNASANDSAIENLKVFIRSKKKLLCGGSLFHVRCCAHILNLVAQDGLSEIKNVIECVRDSVDYIRRSDSRLKVFTEIVKQLNLRERKLIDDCKTSPSDWEKVVKVCSLLEVFWKATHVISGSYYPTSNLFLQEVVRVKVELDNKSQSSDDFIYDMVNSMKRKFDKYWGESNLLMAIAAVLDPRYKMMALEFFFPKLYSPEKAATELAFVRRTLYDLYSEYVSMCSAESNASGSGSTSQSMWMLEMLKQELFCLN